MKKKKKKTTSSSLTSKKQKKKTKIPSFQVAFFVWKPGWVGMANGQTRVLLPSFKEKKNQNNFQGQLFFGN